MIFDKQLKNERYGGAYSSRVLSFLTVNIGACTTTGKILHGAIQSASFLAGDQALLADKRTHVSLPAMKITVFVDIWEALDEVTADRKRRIFTWKA